MIILFVLNTTRCAVVQTTLSTYLYYICAMYDVIGNYDLPLEVPMHSMYGNEFIEISDLMTLMCEIN